jgi:hypothetical protein
MSRRAENLVSRVTKHEDTRSGEVARRPRAIHLREDACHEIIHFRDLDTRHWYIDTREIRVPEVVKVRTSEVSKTRGVI